MAAGSAHAADIAAPPIYDPVSTPAAPCGTGTPPPGRFAPDLRPPSDGATLIVSGAWWVSMFPGLALMLTVLCFNLMGDGLRDLADPTRRK